MTRRILIPLATLLLGATALQVAQAQQFPTKPLRIVVGFPAGGPADFFARALGQKLSEVAGQQVLVDNRPGASATIGADNVAKSPPDGYSMFLAGVGSVAVAPFIFARLPYDPLKDLAPVSMVVKVPELLVTHPSIPARTIKELVALAKRRPGQLTFSSAGTGGMPHVAGEQFKLAAGIDIVHIPYKGAAPAVTDMIGGHNHMGFWDLPVVLPHVNSGKLNAIGLATTARSPVLPNVPTFIESGLPGVDADNWYALMVPGATPRDVIGRLNALAVKALQSKEVKDRYAQQGSEPSWSTPEELGAFVRAETVKWGKVVKAAGIRME